MGHLKVQLYHGGAFAGRMGAYGRHELSRGCVQTSLRAPSKGRTCNIEEIKGQTTMANDYTRAKNLNYTHAQTKPSKQLQTALHSRMHFSWNSNFGLT